MKESVKKGITHQQTILLILHVYTYVKYLYLHHSDTQYCIAEYIKMKITERYDLLFLNQFVGFPYPQQGHRKKLVIL